MRNLLTAFFVSLRLLITILLLGTATAAFNCLLAWNYCNWHNFKTSVTIFSTVWGLIVYVLLRLLGVLNSKSKIEYAKTVVEKIEQRRLSEEQHRLDEQRARIVWNATKVTWQVVDNMLNKDYVKGYRRKDGTYVRGHYRRKGK